MADNNPTAILYSKGDLRLQHKDRRPPKEGEVELKIEAVGICGSDVHYWTQGHIGDFVVKEPMVMGHEASGKVVAVGPGVSHLKVGDRVALEPGVPCQKCAHCWEGRYNLCPDITFCATPPHDGCLQKYNTHSAALCHKVPDHVSYEEAALAEPLSVAIQACRRAGVTLGHRVLVSGSGTIGLVCLLTAKAMGANHVAVTDIVAERMELATQLGADITVAVEPKDDGKEVARKICAAIDGQVDVAIDCTGAESALRAAVFAVKAGGVVACVGMGAPDASLPIVDAIVREVDIRGVFRYCNTYPTALGMLAARQVDVLPLITHRFTLQHTVDAFEVAKMGKDGAVKVMINVAS